MVSLPQPCKQCGADVYNYSGSCGKCGYRPESWEQATQRLTQELATSEAENTRLRAALALSDRPCPYCVLPAKDWAKCKSGFPGCARADDAMGCPELGARMHLDLLVKAGEPFIKATQAILTCGLDETHKLIMGITVAQLRTLHAAFEGRHGQADDEGRSCEEEAQTENGEEGQPSSSQT